MIDTRPTYNYGSQVIEFIPYSDDELHQLVETRKARYFHRCESPAYPALGAHVEWISEKVLADALNDLAAFILDGYTVAASTANAPLYLKLQLRKPQALIDADLAQVTELATVEYDAQRYARNEERTRLEVEAIVARRAQEAAELAAKQAVKKQVSEEDKALAELLQIHGVGKAA
jgi:hypothetical protein